MKLLIITQKVNKNDQILGFFHAWLEEFSAQVEQLTIVCLEEGLHSLPENTKVYSLKKEQGSSKIQQLQLATKYIVALQDEYDAVFVHMNPLYVVLFGLFWKQVKKPVFLWYTHKHVDWKLRIAEKFVHTIFTASEQSLRLETPKKLVTGHGIDTHFFAPDPAKKTEGLYVLTVGRIARAKQTKRIIEAIQELPEATLHIVGGAITKEDKVYERECQTFVQEVGLSERVIFHGPVTHHDTRDFYQQADVFVNVSATGSLDKVLLEALACDTPVVTSNEAGKDIKGVCYFNTTEGNLAEQIHTVARDSVNKESMRAYVEREHGLGRLIKKILKCMSED